MPRKKATETSAAQRAKTLDRNRRNAISSERTEIIDPSRDAPEPGSSDSIAASLIEGARALQEMHSQVGEQNVPDLNTHTPTDYASVSGDSPEIPKGAAEQLIEQISNKINGQKVIQRNFELAQNVEISRQGLAKFLQSQVKAGTAMEGVSTTVAQHETQIETTRLEREKALQRAIEADGLQGLRDLVSQEAQQKQALKSAQIAKLEAKTAKLLNDDIGTADTAEALPSDY
ncbi:MAG: hypothetical protein AAFY20_15140 [Cyanobacteria bacterium J06639_14]